MKHISTVPMANLRNLVNEQWKVYKHAHTV